MRERTFVFVVVQIFLRGKVCKCKVVVNLTMMVKVVSKYNVHKIPRRKMQRGKPLIKTVSLLPENSIYKFCQEAKVDAPLLKVLPGEQS